MKIIKGHPPDDLGQTHVKILHAAFMRELESYGVPLRRYAEGTGIVWAEKWAAVLIDEWTTWAGGTPDAFSEMILKRIVSYVHRTEETDFATACLTVLRLSGRVAVEQMLAERKDLLR